MDEIAWRKLLTDWSDVVIRSGEFDHVVTPEMRTARWLGFPGANNRELDALEVRLGSPLPPSYRTFLTVTNGWPVAGPFVERMWSASEIGWVAEQRPDLIEGEAEGRRIYALTYPHAPLGEVSDAQYLQYGANQEPYTYRSEYLKTALAISEMGDGALFLLNPQILLPSGEWEAWFFANWLPGARRYQSFDRLMVAEFQSLLALTE